tara:strand:- start:3357 stop:4583 length:1227 start_codon:yes stop_codon:yes gene_type:complete
MKGALLELAARGTEDANLIGNPQISFFKKVHKKHTNFSKFEFGHHFTGNMQFGQKIKVKIDKKGDLLTKLVLQIKLPDVNIAETNYIDAIGNFMIKDISLKMGGIVIDKLTSDYIDIYYNNYFEFSKQSAYQNLIKKSASAFTIDQNKTDMDLIIPLPFWFTKHIHQALPLINLQYTDIDIEITFKNNNEVYCRHETTEHINDFTSDITPPETAITFDECILFCEYIYLDVPERKHFLAEKELNYLIEQVQENTFNVSANQTIGNYELIFNHPVKELIIYYFSDINKSKNRWDIYTYGEGINIKKPITKIGLSFNGLDRFEPRMAKYFEYYQPIMHHNSAFSESIYYYSFSDNVNNYQPSGSCNFSKIDDARLSITYNTNLEAGTFTVLAVNYNFLKIKNGMAGILFS